MNIINLILVLMIVGIVLYAIENIIPMDSKIAKLIQIVVIALAVFYVLQTLGVTHGLGIYIK